MKYPIIVILLLFLFVAGTRPEVSKVKTPAALGKQLFFDPILSEDSSISCASCHKPEYAFADTIPFSRGVHGRLGKRNAPSVMNMSSREAFFWDGRAGSLEAQALFPIADVNEMNLPIAKAVVRLRNSKRYRQLFMELFGKQPDKNNLGLALAAFEKTLETTHTPHDRWMDGKADSLNEQQIHGRNIFLNKGHCFDCHFSPDFTGDEYRSIGLFNGKQWNDSGRYNQTHRKSDIGKFKVPGLRNVAVTAPYMHDGSFKTLREVIDYYDEPDKTVPNALNRDTVMNKPLHLSESEKVDLEAYLHALTDDRFRK